MTNSPTDAIEKLIEWHTDRLGLELRAQAKQARTQLADLLARLSALEAEKLSRTADVGHGVGCCSGGNASPGESANLPDRKDGPSKGLSQSSLNAAKELASDSAHIPLIADIIERHAALARDQKEGK